MYNTALFNNPTALDIDERGIIYVADTGNNRIRRISARRPPLQIIPREKSTPSKSKASTSSNGNDDELSSSSSMSSSPSSNHTSSSTSTSSTTSATTFSTTSSMTSHSRESMRWRGRRRGGVESFAQPTSSSLSSSVSQSSMLQTMQPSNASNATLTSSDSSNAGSNAADASPPSSTSSFLLEAQKRAAQDEQLFVEGQASSDVLFIFDDATEIHAHRLILSHRSTFFQTLLDNEARSSNQLSYGNSRQPLRVRIKDIERAVFMEIIRYIYCGHVEITSSKLIDVIKIAKIYQMHELVNMLWPVVVDALDVENVCDILRMANSSGLTDVTEHCMVYFQRHKSQIFTTESYARFKESEPTLGMKILEEMHSREPIVS